MFRAILKVAVFSIAFAFVEASVVVYLRHLLGSTQPGIAFLEPQTVVKIISDTALLNVERIREAATLVMLGAVAALAGKNLKEKIAYFFLSFGIWDIFYYVFLRLTIGWPKNLGDLDVFFLLPTPWAGPVIVPVAISAVLILASLVYLTNRKWR